MQFSHPNDSVAQANSSDALSLPPPTTAVPLAESFQLPNLPTDRNRFDIGDIAENLVIHDQ